MGQASGLPSGKQKRLSARENKVLHAAMGANGAVIVNSGDGAPASFQQVTRELCEILLTSEYGAEGLVGRSSQSHKATTLPCAAKAEVKLKA